MTNIEKLIKDPANTCIGCIHGRPYISGECYCTISGKILLAGKLLGTDSGCGYISKKDVLI